MRDFFAAHLGSGPIAAKIGDIWSLDDRLEQAKAAHNRELQRTLQDQITALAGELWRTVLRAASFGQTRSNLAAGIYMALDSTAVGQPAGPDAFRRCWLEYVQRELGSGRYLPHQLQSQGLADFWDTVTTPFPDKATLRGLPGPWFYLDFSFTLAEPVLTRDDTSFYILENPIRKDKVFAMPSVAASSWKGNLRWTATKQLVDWWQGLSQIERLRPEHVEAFAHRRLYLTQLFGTEKGEDDGHSGMRAYLDRTGGESATGSYRRKLVDYLQELGLAEEQADEGRLAGSLYCFPTFFAAIDLEVINPHDRRTGAGERPVLMESVPRDANGCFCLLYVSMAVTSGSTEQIRIIAASHLRLVTDAVRDMITLYGFSAKKSSGFGVAHSELPETGSLRLWSRPAAYEFNALAPVAEQRTLEVAVREACDDLLGEGTG